MLKYLTIHETKQFSIFLPTHFWRAFLLNRFSKTLTFPSKNILPHIGRTQTHTLTYVVGEETLFEHTVIEAYFVSLACVRIHVSKYDWILHGETHIVSDFRSK